MSAILFVRHGPTEWNLQGLIQGQSDIPLCDEGRAEVRRWSLRDDFNSFEWYASPLVRARETAELLSGGECRLERRLREASWGEWEGWSLERLRQDIGEIFAGADE